MNQLPHLAALHLRALHPRIVTAEAAGDTASLEALLHPGFEAMNPRAEWQGREAFLRDAQTRRATLAVAQDLTVRVHGCVAITQCLIHTIEAGDAHVRTRATDVFCWRDGAWQWFNAHRTLLRPDAPEAIGAGARPACGTWHGADAGADDETTLRALNDNYVRAFRECDLAWYDAHLEPGYTVVNSDGSLDDRDRALHAFAQPDFERHLKHFPVVNTRLRRIEDVALLHAENPYERKDGKRGENRYTDIWWKRADGRWGCITAHITTFRAAA